MLFYPLANAFRIKGWGNDDCSGDPIAEYDLPSNNELWYEPEGYGTSFMYESSIGCQLQCVDGDFIGDSFFTTAQNECFNPGPEIFFVACKDIS